MLLSFVHNPAFAADWKRLGYGDDDLRHLEQALIDRPTAGAVMAGTGGVWKMRFAPAGRGKSGACRVVYGLFPDVAHVHLLLAFGKNEQSNLTAAEKAMCRTLMADIAAAYDEGVWR